MKEYHKIETLFKRDMEGTKKLIPDAYCDETVEFLKNVNRVWTEKVDGTNTRVYWDGHSVSFGGRTDKADIPAPLLARLQELFGGEESAQIFEQLFGEKEVTLYGEGYGAKIQNGGNYVEDGKSVDFILFDVMVGDMFLKRDAIVEIAAAFGIFAVPVVWEGNISSAVEYIKLHPMSMLGTHMHEMEGIVGKPEVELKDRRGRRIIVKIKYKDFC